MIIIPPNAIVGVSWSPSGLPPFMISRERILWDKSDDRKFQASIVAISTMPAIHWSLCVCGQPLSTWGLENIPCCNMLTTEYATQIP